MKKLIVLLGVFTLCSSAFGQSAEEVVASYIKTLGGAEKLNAIESIEMKAKVDYGGMSIPIQMINLKDGRSLLKINFQGKEIVQAAFDGSISWSTNFMTMKAEKNDAEVTENVKRSTGDFISPLYGYKEKGYSLELLPNETIEGVDCIKLKLTKKTQLVDGQEVPNVEYYYFDKENYVPIVIEAEIPSGEMKGQISQTLYSDYQEVQGIYFAFSMTQRIKDGMGQTIVFDTVELNKKFEDKEFIYPGE